MHDISLILDHSLATGCYDLGVDDDLVPAIDLFLDVDGKLRRRVGDDVETDLLAFVLHVRLMQRLDDLAVEQIDDRLRRAGGHEDALHGFGFLALDAVFDHGRHVGQRRGAFERGHRDAVQRSGEDVRRWPG